MKNKNSYKVLIIMMVLALALTACAQPAQEEPGEALTKVKIQLSWIKQGENHGIFNAVEEGFYKDEGLDVEVIAGGPDIRPMALVAAGEVDFAMGHPVEVIAGRSNDVPVVSVLQEFQDSMTVYVAKKANGFETIEDIKDAKFGIWYAGGEYEPQLMAELSGVGIDNVNWVAQKYSMVEFYEDKVDIASATLHNEFHVLLNAGYTLEDLTVYRPSDYGAALVNNSIYTTEKMIKEHPEIVQAFVNATIRGWKWGLQNPDKAVQNVLKHNPDLETQKQLYQVEETNKLSTARSAKEFGIGYLNYADWEVSQEALIVLGLIPEPIDLNSAFDLAFWNNCPKEYKTLDDLDMNVIYARIEENLK